MTSAYSKHLPSDFSSKMLEDIHDGENYECSHCGIEAHQLLCCKTCYIFGRHKLPEIFQCFFCSSECYELSKENHESAYHRQMMNFPNCLDKPLHNSDTESERDSDEDDDDDGNGSTYN